MKNKKIMVIGAGSIGSKIIEHVLEYDIDSVRVYDNNEERIFKLKRELKDKRVTYMYGDIRDKDRLRFAMRGVDIVYHTAAMKLVTVCELNPIDATKTNIIGTQNVIDVSIDENIEKLIYISTDKATNPTSVMGASKLLAEKLILAAAYYGEQGRTIFSVVRFGNVIGASSSVIPIFEEQIKNGGPVTITDSRMTRYMMSIDEAIELIFKATELSKGGETFVFKMEEFNIIDVAKDMIGDKNIAIEEIGMNEGEKLYEELLTDYEKDNSIEYGKLIIINPQGKYEN